MDMQRAHSKEARIVTQFMESKGTMHKVYPKRFEKQAPQLFSSYPDVVALILSNEFGIEDIQEIVIFCNYSNDGL